MSVIDKAEDVTILVLIGGAGLLLYYLSKQIPQLGAQLGTWWNTATGGAFAGGASLSDQASAALANAGIGSPSTGAIAAQTASQVANAGGSAQQQQQASQEVTNYASLSQDFYWPTTNQYISAFTTVPGTGLTIYELRKDGYSDPDIATMLNDAAANSGGYGGPSLQDQGVLPQYQSGVDY